MTPTDKPMDRRGAGDRWLAGGQVDGVAFAFGDVVLITSGAHEAHRARVALLMSLGADPLYLVTLLEGGGDVRVKQSSLRKD